MRVLNLRFASVDIVRLDEDGKDLRVLEVNAGVMRSAYKTAPRDLAAKRFTKMPYWCVSG